MPPSGRWVHCSVIPTCIISWCNVHRITVWIRPMEDITYNGVVRAGIHWRRILPESSLRWPGRDSTTFSPSAEPHQTGTKSAIDRSGVFERPKARRGRRDCRRFTPHGVIVIHLKASTPGVCEPVGKLCSLKQSNSSQISATSSK